MIFIIEDIKDGLFIAQADTLSEALNIQGAKFKEGIDTYIRKKE